MSITAHILGRHDYQVSWYRYAGTRPIDLGIRETFTVRAVDVENVVLNHWLVLDPAIYHAIFTVPLPLGGRSIPTQITGAIAESIAVLFLRQRFAANVFHVSITPNSRTADFRATCPSSVSANPNLLAESKGTNARISTPQTLPLESAIEQLTMTEVIRFSKPLNYFRKFVIMTSFPASRIFFVEIS